MGKPTGCKDKGLENYNLMQMFNSSPPPMIFIARVYFPSNAIPWKNVEKLFKKFLIIL